MNYYRQRATAALEARQSLINELRSVAQDKTLTGAEKHQRCEGMESDIQRLEAEARSYVEQGEREAEVRDLERQNPGLIISERRSVPDDGEWRALLPSASEYRDLIAEGTPSAGGYTVPEQTAGRYVDALRAASVFMRAPGLNIIQTDTQNFVLPALAGSTVPGVVSEGAPITEGTDTWSALEFKAHKYADLRQASSEVLADAAFDLRQAIGNTMVRNIAASVDKDAFAGSGTAALFGLVAQGTETVLAAGQTVVTWDSVIEAYCAAEAVGAQPTVIWASPAAAKALRTAKADSAGTYLSGGVTDDPARKALGLPLLVSGNVPAGKAVVADASRVWIGVRQDVSVKQSEHAGFTTDTVFFRATYRLGGVSVDSAEAVQVITPAAA